MIQIKDRVMYGAFLVLLSVFFIASMSVIAKILSENTHPIELAFYRNFIVFCGMSLYLLNHKKGPLLKTKRYKAHISRFLLGTIGLIAGLWSISLLPLTTSLTLYYTAPLFTILLSGPLLQEKVVFFRYSTVLFGFIGVVIVINPNSGNIVLLGLFFAFFDSICSALTQIYLRDLGKTENSFITVYYYMGIGAVATFLMLPFVWIGMPQPENYLLILGLGLTGWLQQITKTKGYAMAPVSVTAPLTYTGIIWAAIFSYIFWNTLPNTYFWFGASIIIASNLIIIWRENKKKIDA